MIRVIPKECTGCLLGSAVSVAWAGWVTVILQGNYSVSGRFRRLDVSRSKGENALLLVNLVLQTTLEILVKTNDHNIIRCPYLATFVTC